MQNTKEVCYIFSTTLPMMCIVPFSFFSIKNIYQYVAKVRFLEDVSDISANSLGKARMFFCFYLDFNIGFVRIKKPFSNDIPNWQPEPVKIPSINTPALRHYLMDKKAFVVGMGINCSILGICLSCGKKSSDQFFQRIAL